MRTVTKAAVAAKEESFENLPEQVREALGELAGQAKEGLLALSVGVGLSVLGELMEAEVDQVVGPKGRHNPKRSAVRHGHDQGPVTLGGRRVTVKRPRVRSADGAEEVELATYGHFADRDPLTQVVLEQMLAGVSTRRFERTREPVGEELEAASSSTSRSAVSRGFVARTRENLQELMARRLDDVRLAALMVDGLEIKGRTNVVALGISTEGVKVALGLWEGSTENSTVVSALLSDLVDRGLDTEQGVLVVLDGAKALHKAVRDVLGVRTPVQRCVRHKERNVVEHLPERERGRVRAKAARGLGAQRPCPRPGAPGGARHRAGARPPRRRRLTARGHGRDAHRDPPGNRGQVEADAGVKQPLRVDDRVREAQLAQRQALA